ncbi:MAG: membrane dipeptidase [Acidobacteria bacterium]|nr:membrane dipeptidase [Acidobacteriota bacterium]
MKRSKKSRLWIRFSILAAALAGMTGSDLFRIRLGGGPGTASGQAAARKFFVFDAHMHPTSSTYHRGGDLEKPGPDTRFSLALARAGGLGAAFFNTSIDEFYEVNHIAVKDALKQIDHFYRQVAMHPDQIGVATSADEIHALQKEGKIAAVLAIEGALAIESDLGVLRMLHRLGLREMNLVHLLENNIGDVGFSTKNNGKGSGLTDFGRQLVAEMNRLGIMIDLSHTAEQTIREVMEITTQPPVTTHSGVRALVNAPGHWSDDMIQILAKKGGVFCVPLLPMTVSQEFQTKYHSGRPRGSALLGFDPLVYTGDPARIYDYIAELRKKADADRGSRAEERRRSLPAISGWVDSIDYVAKLVGTDHVGLSTDFGGYPVNLKDMQNAGDYQAVAQALLRRGYSETDVAKIMGENMLRVFDQTVRTASAP